MTTFRFKINSAQQVNACTLISLGVIAALLKKSLEELDQPTLKELLAEQVVTRSRQYEIVLACGLVRVNGTSMPTLEDYEICFDISHYILHEAAFYFFQKGIAGSGSCLTKIELNRSVMDALHKEFLRDYPRLSQAQLNQIQLLAQHTMPRGQGLMTSEACAMLGAASLSQIGFAARIKSMPAEAQSATATNTTLLAEEFVKNRRELGIEAMALTSLIPDGFIEKASEKGWELNGASLEQIKFLFDAMMPSVAGPTSPSVRPQVFAIVDSMAHDSGLLVTIDAHAISVVYKDRWFYGFNSATGSFIKTDDMDDIVNYVMEVHRPGYEIKMEHFTYVVGADLSLAAAGAGRECVPSAPPMGLWPADVEAAQTAAVPVASPFAVPTPPPMSAVATPCPPPAYTGVGFFVPGSPVHLSEVAGSILSALPEGATSDHVWRVNTYKFSTPEKLDLIICGAYWNMLNRCHSKAANRSGDFSNNPMNLTESEDAYIVRKQLQLREIISIINSPAFSLDFMFLQEADWWLNTSLRHEYQTALAEKSWAIQATPGKSHRLLVTLYNTKTLQLDERSIAKGCFPSKGKYCGFPLQFMQLAARRPVRLVNLHLDYAVEYYQLLPAYQRACVDENIACVMAGDCNRGSNNTDLRNNPKKMANMIGDWHAATCLSSVADGRLSTRNPRHLEETNVIDGAFVSPENKGRVTITELGGYQFVEDEVTRMISMIPYDPGTHAMHQSITSEPWQRLLHLRQQVLSQIGQLYVRNSGRDIFNARDQVTFTELSRKLLEIAQLNPRLAYPADKAALKRLALEHVGESEVGVIEEGATADSSKKCVIC